LFFYCKSYTAFLYFLVAYELFFSCYFILSLTLSIYCVKSYFSDYKIFIFDFCLVINYSFYFSWYSYFCLYDSSYVILWSDIDFYLI